jgi:hypothetical protein
MSGTRRQGEGGRNIKSIQSSRQTDKLGNRPDANRKDRATTTPAQQEGSGHHITAMRMQAWATNSGACPAGMPTVSGPEAADLDQQGRQDLLEHQHERDPGHSGSGPKGGKVYDRHRAFGAVSGA